MRHMRNESPTVFFDVGSTLLFPSPSVGEMFVQVANSRGHEVDQDLVSLHIPEIDDYYEREYTRDGDFWCSHDRAVQIWKDMYSLLSHRTGLKSDSKGLSDEMYQRYLLASSWGVYEDVRPCLGALKKLGCKLGIISNWDASLKSLIWGLGLLPYFDVVISSASVGYRKPDPVIFEIALSEMGICADTAFHVGDLPEADGAAARVGITPVIIDRKAAFPHCEHRTIASLSELPEIMGCSMVS